MWLRLDDGTWTTIAMEEGVNQGCPLSCTLAAIVLHAILAPLAQKLRDRAAARLAQGDPGDDGFGGISDPMAYVDDNQVVIYLADALFFLEEFDGLAKPKGIYMNTIKTRICTSTSGSSALPAIERRYGPALADSIRKALATYSTKPAPTPADPDATVPVEITTGLRILGQPVGSAAFAREFFDTAISKVESHVDSLFSSISPTKPRYFGFSPNVPCTNALTFWALKFFIFWMMSTQTLGMHGTVPSPTVSIA